MIYLNKSDRATPEWFTLSVISVFSGSSLSTSFFVLLSMKDGTV